MFPPVMWKIGNLDPNPVLNPVASNLIPHKSEFTLIFLNPNKKSSCFESNTITVTYYNMGKLKSESESTKFCIWILNRNPNSAKKRPWIWIWGRIGIAMSLVSTHSIIMTVWMWRSLYLAVNFMWLKGISNRFKNIFKSLDIENPPINAPGQKHLTLMMA